MTISCVRTLVPALSNFTYGNPFLASTTPGPCIDHTRSKAIGVARVVVQGANMQSRWLKPRPFVQFSVQGHNEVRTTALETRTDSPNWFSEANDVLIYSLKENLEFKVFNHHGIRKPSLIGSAVFSLSSLDKDPRKIGEEVSILKGGTFVMGRLLFNIFYYPVVPPSNEVSEAGLVTLRLHEARGFGWETYSRKARALAVTISLGWTAPPIYESTPSLHVDPAFWGSTFEFLCTKKSLTTIVVKLVEQNATRTPTVFGHVSMSLEDMLTTQDCGKEWWPLAGSREGRLRMALEWRPVQMNLY